jgi:hypothetical protein
MGCPVVIFCSGDVCVAREDFTFSPARVTRRQSAVLGQFSAAAAAEQAAARGFHPAAASSRDPGAVMVPLSGIGETRQDVLVLQLREILENVLFGRAGRELRQHVVHSDAQAPNAGLPTSFAKLHRDAVEAHASDSRQHRRLCQESAVLG